MREYIQIVNTQTAIASAQLAAFAASQVFPIVDQKFRVLYASLSCADPDLKFKLGVRAAGQSASPSIAFNFLAADGATILDILYLKTEPLILITAAVAGGLIDTTGGSYKLCVNGALAEPIFVKGRGGYPVGTAFLQLVAGIPVVNSDIAAPHNFTTVLSAIVEHGSE
jgi:hypothetical protein